MNEKKKEEMATQFVGITGAKISQANTVLEMSNYNMEKAMNLFFEGGIFSNQGTSSSTPTPKKIRPPMPQRISRLNTFNYPRNNHFQNGFNQDLPRNIREMVGFGNFNQPKKKKTKVETKFDELFSSPIKLLYKGNLEEAKRHGEKTGKYIIVNIQSQTEFDALRLNRDVWKDDVIEEIIKAWFLLWQVDFQHREGRRFCAYYKVQKYPHVCILDPRTGESIKSWSGFISPEKMAEEYNSPLEKKEDVFERKNDEKMEIEDEELQAAIRLSMGQNSNKKKEERKPIVIDEEDDIQKAIKASLLEMEEEKKKEEEEEKKKKGEEKKEEEKREEEKKKKEEEEKQKKLDYNFEGYEKYILDNSKKENSTRIQLRLPNGKRQVYRVSLDTPLAVIYSMFYNLLQEEDKEKPFDVIFFNAKLDNERNTTLKQKGITNSSLSIIFTNN